MNNPLNLFWLALFINLAQAKVIKEEGASVEEMASWDISVRHFLN